MIGKNSERPKSLDETLYMIGKIFERSKLTGQTVEMIEHRYEKVRNPYQTVWMIEFRCEKSKFIDQTTGMVGNRYQTLTKPQIWYGVVWKMLKSAKMKIFSKYWKSSILFYTWNIFNTWNIFKTFQLFHGFTAKLVLKRLAFREKNAKKYFSSLASLARRGLALVLSGGGARPRFASFARSYAVARENSLSHRLALALWALNNIYYIILY